MIVDLLFNSQVNIRAMGLFYRTTDKVVEQQRKIDELEKKNIEREEKLNVLDQKFKDVKMSAKGLIAEFQNTLKGRS